MFDQSLTTISNYTGDVTVNIVILTSKQLYIGDTFSISCIAQGYPVPNVQLEKILNEEQWVKLPIKPGISHQAPKFNFTFNLRDTRGDTSGVYRCFAYNDIGVIATSMNLTIDISGKKAFPIVTQN